MKFIQLILRRPTSVILLIAAVVVFGVSALTGMPLEYMPDMSMPMELVLVTWPGADAGSIDRLVTQPIEEECETLTDIDTVASTTYDNYTMIQLTYDYSASLDDAYMELKAAMDNLANQLPEGCESPVIMEISMDSQATMSISATAEEGMDVQGYLTDTVAPVLEGVSGVARVEVSGAQAEYLRIVLDEARLEQYGLTISDVGSAIAAADFDMPVGSVTMGTQDVALAARGDIQVDSLDLRSTPLQTRTGQMIRLTDVTQFLNLYREDAESLSRYNGQESVLLEITKQDSASTIAVCGEVENTLERFARDGISFTVINSEADSVLDTLAEVLQTLLIGVALTMAVLLLFFGSVRASLIVGISMPLSILLAIILLNFAGYAFDLMTGTALIIAIGMIVDNSIVILESCFRAKSEGLGFRDAAAKGTSSMLMSIAAGTLTTVVVYIPLAMADGMSGMMAGPLSWTILLTMSASFLCAVVVIPLAFTLVKPVPKEDLPVNRLLDRCRSGYRRVMPSLLRHPGRVLGAAVASLLAALLLASQIEFVLFPSDYDGSIQVDAVFRSGTKLEVMDQQVQELEAALLADENFEDVSLNISGNTATFLAYAAPDCRRTSEASVEAYTQQFGHTPNMDVAVSPLSPSDMGALATSNETDITLVADDMASLEEGAALVEEAMAQVPGVLRIENPFSQSRGKGQLVIDAQRAIGAGTSQAAVATQVSHLLNGMTAATIDHGGEEYDVVLEYPEGKYDDITALMGHPIRTQAGTYIALEDVATIEYTTTLPSISRQDGQYITTLTATTTDAAKYSAADAIGAAVEELNLPEGVSRGMSAMDQMSEDEIGGLTGTLLTAAFLVFLVMAVQFDSARLSVMVMLCIPFGLVGSFGMVFLSGAPMSMLGLMGFLMLFGIAVNNGIYLVDGTNELRKTMTLEEALIQAGATRLRPILMTTLTTVISMVPMLFSSSSGMGMMKEMAYIIIGGLVASTILAMFLMPAFYLLIRGENVDGTKRAGILRRVREKAARKT